MNIQGDLFCVVLIFRKKVNHIRVEKKRTRQSVLLGVSHYRIIPTLVTLVSPAASMNAFNLLLHSC